MNIVKYRKIFYFISAVLILSSVAAILFWGLRPGVDFSGGSLLEITFAADSPEAEEATEVLNDLGFEGASVRTSADGLILRLREISSAEKDTIIQSFAFGGKYAPSEKTFSSVGPILGQEALRKSWTAILLVLLAIILFITFAFRKVSKPISSWIYGAVTIFALLHDVLIPTGLFAVLGHFAGFEVDTLFVTALLVILGFSVHDTIVVFDRVRENLRRNEESKDKKDFDSLVNDSIKETFVRSVNTSLTTLLAVLVLYIFGPETIRSFNLVLLAGLIVGVYSSIFVAAPLLVTINRWKAQRLT